MDRGTGGVTLRGGVAGSTVALLLLTGSAALAQPGPSRAGIYKSVFTTDSGFELRCAIRVPEGYRHETPAPMVLSLHHGFRRSEPFPAYYGGAMLEALTFPGLAKLDAVIVAPDSHGMRWQDDEITAAVLDLVEGVKESYSIDERRIAVAGYSMGGRGALHYAARFGELFTAVISIAARVDLETAMRVRAPLLLIHGARDERVPIAPVEATAAQLRALGRRVDLVAVPEQGHFGAEDYVRPLRRAVPWLREAWSDRP